MNTAHCPKVHAGPLLPEYSECNSGAPGENLAGGVKNPSKFRKHRDSRILYNLLGRILRLKGPREMMSFQMDGEQDVPSVLRMQF